MKSKKRNFPNPVARGFPPAYDVSFKKIVIRYAEQNGDLEAKLRYGICENTIKRWRGMKDEIMEQASQRTRKSQRRTTGQGSLSDSSSYRESEDGLIKETNSLDLDSMPLQQRLSKDLKDTPSTSQSSTSPLHSLPLSPTKLKVTRQGRPGGSGPSIAPTPSQICLKWNSHHVNMQTSFPTLLTKEQYVDATLVSEGKTLKCHRMILSSCSSYFEEILSGILPFQHPVLFMRDIPFWVLKSLCDFMYAGEVHISQDKLSELLAAANTLKIKGLATSIQKTGGTGAPTPEIKKEISTVPPLSSIKLEKGEPLMSSQNNETRRVLRGKDERKIVQRYIPIHRLKVEERRAAAQASSRVAMPKVMSTAKLSLKKLDKPAQKPLNSKTPLRKPADIGSRTNNRQKSVPSTASAKEKVNEPQLLKKDHITDPLDLLQPVYEEIAKEPQFAGAKSVSPSKLKDRYIPLRKSLVKKMRKRKFTEDREESPPAVYSSRKGTRSRPNVKIPKFFDSHYDEKAKHATEATIVREPHTDQNDPLIGVEVPEIKAEPLDVEEAAIEMEENLVSYMEPDLEMVSPEGEEIIGGCDPLVNNTPDPKRSIPDLFKKDSQPLIIDVHTVSELDARLIGNVEIVDIAKISENSQVEEEAAEIADCRFDSAQGETSQIVISNVQSMAEIVEDVAKEIPTGAKLDTADLHGEGGSADAIDPLAAQDFNKDEKSNELQISSLGSLEDKIENVHLNSQGEGSKETNYGEFREPLEESPMDFISENVEEIHPEASSNLTNAEELQEGFNIVNEPPSENVTEVLTSPRDGLPVTVLENQFTPVSENQSNENPENVIPVEQCAPSTSLNTIYNTSAYDEAEDFTKDVEFDDLSAQRYATFSSLVGLHGGSLEPIEEAAVAAPPSGDCEASCQKNENKVDEEEGEFPGFEEGDVVMNETGGEVNQAGANEDSEHTLERIVNDLNESLYDITRK